MYRFEDDPFNSSEGFGSNFYKELMDQEENKTKNITVEAEDVEYEEVTGGEESVPTFKVEKGFDKAMAPLIKKAQEQVSDNKALAVEVSETFKKLFEDLNETYGLDVKFDFNSFTQTLSYMIKPKSKAAIEIYISEAYSRVRASLYLMYLNAISQLSTQILDPKFITSNSMSYQDKLILMRELFQYINSLNAIYKEVDIKDSDIKLKKLSENDKAESDLQSEEVQEFLANLSRSVKSTT
jgi:hypothetical protein